MHMEGECWQWYRLVFHFFGGDMRVNCLFLYLLHLLCKSMAIFRRQMGVRNQTMRHQSILALIHIYIMRCLCGRAWIWQPCNWKHIKFTVCSNPKMDRQFNGCFYNFSVEDENIIHNARMILFLLVSIFLTAIFLSGDPFEYLLLFIEHCRFICYIWRICFHLFLYVCTGSGTIIFAFSYFIEMGFAIEWHS